MGENTLSGPCNTPKESHCPPKIQNNTAKEICEQVERKKKSLGESMLDSTPWGTASKLVDGILGGNEAEINVALNINVEVDNRNLVEEMNVCRNNMQNVNMNNIDQKACMKTILESLPKEDRKDALPVILADMKANGNKQRNTINAEQKCKLSAVIRALSTADTNIDNAALIQKIQESEQGSGGNKSTVNHCASIKQNVSACNYLRKSSCCVNDVFNKNSNIINACGEANNNDQRNYITSVQDCVLGTKTKAESKTTSTIKNIMKAVIKQKAKLGSSCASCVVVCIAMLIIGCFFMDMF